MKLGFRRKLFLSAMFLISLVALPSGFYLHRALQTWSQEQIGAELGRQVETVRILVEETEAFTRDTRALSPMVLRVAEASTSTIQVVDDKGIVLVDTSPKKSARLSGEQLARWAALASSQDLDFEGREGAAMVRGFKTPSSGKTGFVRASFSKEQLAETFDRLRLLIMFAGLLGLAATLLVSWLATHLVAGMMRGLVEHTNLMARGAGSSLERVEQDELGGLAMSITQLAEELARSVEELAKERDRFSTILESMSEAVIALDENHCVRLINRAAQEFFAPQLAAFDGQVEGHRVTSMIKIPALLDLLEDAREGRTSISELTLPGPPERRVMAHITPRPGGGGELLVMHDVTELRKLETIRRDFVANVSHELRTPVSVIMLNAETILADDDLVGASPHARRFIEGLHRNAERLSRLISDLLDISRIEAGRFRLELEPVSVFGASLRVLDALEEKAERKKQELELDVDLELLVFADAKALDQMLFNLIDNAIKYAPEGGHIIVRAARSDVSRAGSERPFVRIEIADDGPGLHAKHRPRIFERFYRIDDGRSRDVGGTGLGLAIVKHLAQAMGGRVGVHPNEPKGSVFWVRLLEADAQDEPEIEVAQAVDTLPQTH